MTYRGSPAKNDGSVEAAEARSAASDGSEGYSSSTLRLESGTRSSLASLPSLIAGKYEVLSELGRGGMGVVVAARHIQLNHDVAIKLLVGGDGPLDEVGVARFLREAKTCLAIQNEHVVRVMDVGTLDTGAPYMVMERLVGEDLDAVMRAQGPLPFGEAVDYVLQACEAIAEAHARGIVHRDLKPANLFRTRRADGTFLIKVLDFGISKAKASVIEDRALTASATILGSPSYMSPEQIRNAKTVDERTDIWALGLILYELLSGRLPFGGDQIGAIHAAILVDPPHPLAGLCPDLPAPLVQVIERCLEKLPAKRTANVAELARELGPFAPRATSSVDRVVAIAGSGVHSVEAFRETQESVPPSERSSPSSRRSPTSSKASSVLATSAEIAWATSEKPRALPQDSREAVVVTNDVARPVASASPPRKRSWWPVLAIAGAGAMLAIGWAARPVSPAPVGAASARPPVDVPIPSASLQASTSVVPLAASMAPAVEQASSEPPSLSPRPATAQSSPPRTRVTTPRAPVARPASPGAHPPSISPLDGRK